MALLKWQLNLNASHTNYGLIKEKNYNNLVQKWLDDNGVLMYSTLKGLQKHQKVKSVRKITSNDSKSYLGYFNELMDEYNIFTVTILVKDLFTLIFLL